MKTSIYIQPEEGGEGWYGLYLEYQRGDQRKANRRLAGAKERMHENARNNPVRSGKPSYVWTNGYGDR